jgi:transposase
MSHAIEIRERAVGLLEEGYTQEFISKLLKVGTTSIKRWKNRIRNEGAFSAIYDSSNRTAPKLPAEKLDEYYKANNDALLKEAADHFNCTPQAVFYACKRNKITYKKKNLITKSVTNKNARHSLRA